MSSSARQLDAVTDASPFGFVEHITLETPEHGGVRQATAATDHAVVTQAFESRLHGQSTELCLPGRHTLSVRTVRRDGGYLEYSTDLSLVKPSLTRVSMFPLGRALGAVMAGLFAVVGFVSAMDPAAPSPGPFLAAGFAFACIAVLVALSAFRGMTLSVEVRSLHGDVALVRLTGAAFRLRTGGPFFDELARRIEAAHGDEFRPRAHLLRDELREHQRLFSLGVLTRQEYEAGKTRILAAH